MLQTGGQAMPGSERTVQVQPESMLSQVEMPDPELQGQDLPCQNLPGQTPEAAPLFAKIDLPERADPLADPSLLEFLRSHQGQPVEIDASRLRSPNGPLVETLLVAAMAWRKKGVGFRITGLAPGHVAQLRWLGLAAPLGLAPADEAQPL